MDRPSHRRAAYTGKKYIVKFEGTSNGHNDQTLVTTSAPAPAASGGATAG